mgnify:CR=1 FL=1
MSEIKKENYDLALGKDQIDFYNENGTLHRTEKVTIEHERDGQARVLNAMGQIFVVPRHILKEIP